MEKEEIEILSKEIIKKVEDDLQNCVPILESTLLGDNQNSISFEEYLDQLQKTLKKSTCQGSWTNEQLVVNCLDCRLTDNSCICVNCFLKGNHQGHRVTLSYSSGSCDCGNPFLWSPKGFCSDHPGPEQNPELTQLTKETRIKLISVSRAALSKYVQFSISNDSIFCDVTDFLSNLVSIGDATRRCVSLAMQEESIDIYELFKNCYKLNETAVNKLLNFLGMMINDHVFERFNSMSFMNDFLKYLHKNHEYGIDLSLDTELFHELYGFTFHATSVPIVSQLIKESAIDWSTIFKESFKFLIDNSFAQMSKEYLDRSEFYVSNFRIIRILKSAFSVFDNNDPKLIELLDDFASIIINYELSYPFCRTFGQKYDDPQQTQTPQFKITYSLYEMNNLFSEQKIYTTKPLKLIENFFNKKVFESIDKLHKIEGEFDRDFHNHNVLDRNVDISLSFPCHLLAFTCLNLNETKTLVDYVSEVTDNVELFMKNWAVLPLRLISASNLSHFNFFVRNSEDVIDSLYSVKKMTNVKIRFVPSFSLLQTLLKSTKDVDGFLLMIISTHGFFNVEMNLRKKSSDQLDDDQQRLILLIIFHFVSCLIFDTMCIENNYFQMRRLRIISELMMKGDLSFDKIDLLWYDNLIDDEQFFEDLLSYTSRIKTKSGSKFHLTNNSEWHPLLPFMKINEVIPLIQKFVDNNPDSLINFPELPEDSRRLLFSPVLWALEYFILRRRCCRDYKIIHQLIFNVLIITKQNCEQNQQDNDNDGDNNEADDIVVVVKDFIDMANQLKKFTFGQFLKAKIAFSDIKEDKKSMIELIESHGKIGLTVLTRMNIKTENSDSSPLSNEMLKKNKERAKKIKLQIMGNFAQKQKLFQSTSDSQKSDNEDNKTEKMHNMDCSVCHLENNDDCFVYPALVLKSPLSSYLSWHFKDAKLVSENDETNLMPSDVPDSFETFNNVRICLHQIHSKCINNKIFKCPADRCLRNASLPIIAGICDTETELKETVFLPAKNFIQKAYYNDLKFAVYSLASQIEVLEVRHRSNPDCLNDSMVQPTLSNIYICIYHVLRTNSQKVLSDENENNEEFEFYTDVNNNTIKRKRIHLSPLMKYILLSLQTAPTQKVDMENFLNEKSLNIGLDSDYKMLQFLRCVAIFDHFARCHKLTEKVETEFIDWDEILSSSYLCKHYNIQHAFKAGNDGDEEMTLPMFSFIKLPKNFLDLIHPPYSAPILDCVGGESILCLLTGKMIFSESFKIDSIYDFIDAEFNGSFSIFLELNGGNASNIVIIDHECDTLLRISTFYVDRFGDVDIGLKYGSLLTLNESNQEEIVDKFLSGSWSNNISDLKA